MSSSASSSARTTTSRSRSRCRSSSRAPARRSGGRVRRPEEDRPRRRARDRPGSVHRRGGRAERSSTSRRRSSSSYSSSRGGRARSSRASCCSNVSGTTSTWATPGSLTWRCSGSAQGRGRPKQPQMIKDGARRRLPLRRGVSPAHPPPVGRTTLGAASRCLRPHRRPLRRRALGRLLFPSSREARLSDSVDRALEQWPLQPRPSRARPSRRPTRRENVEPARRLRAPRWVRHGRIDGPSASSPSTSCRGASAGAAGFASWSPTASSPTSARDRRKRRYLSSSAGEVPSPTPSSTTSTPRSASGRSSPSSATNPARCVCRSRPARRAGRLLPRPAHLAPVARASEAAHSAGRRACSRRASRFEPDDEFGAWAASFNEMAEALEAKISALSEAQARERRFTSDVSHELRTPLTALVAEASLLAEQLDRMPGEARRPAELLVNDVARLRDLVEDLMEISRLDAGETSVREEHVDLASLVRAAVRSRRWEDRCASKATRSSSRDHRRLERIASNLVGNALEHGGRDVACRRRARRSRRLRRGERPRGPASRRTGYRTSSTASTRRTPRAPPGKRPRPRHRARERAPARRRHRGLERGRPRTRFTLRLPA